VSRCALVVDDVIPRSGWGSGYPRSAQIVRALARCSDEVDVCALQENPGPDAAADSFPSNVRSVAGYGYEAFQSALRAVNGRLGLLWIGRPHNLAKVFLAHQMWPRLFAGVRIVYDAEAVSASRTIMERDLGGQPMTRLQRRVLLRDELRPTEIAHAIVCVSQLEQQLIRDVTGRTPAIVAAAAEIAETPASFSDRRDFVFLGALWNSQSPNADSVRFFVECVLPIIVRRSDAKLRIAGSGSDQAAWLRSIAGQRVEIAGPIDDLAELFGQARVFVAPTRYAGGIPQKVIDAARHGVPVAGTGLIAAQLGWRDGQELRVADEPALMAEACLALYEDQGLWKRIRSTALAAVRRDFDPAAFDAAVALAAWGPIDAPSGSGATLPAPA